MNLAIGILAAALAGACFDTAVVLQAREARQVDRSFSQRPQLLGRLVRSRRWRLATGLAILGWPLQLLALHLAPLTVVQPVMMLGLVLLVWLAVRMLGEKAGKREIAATAMIIAGVAVITYAAPKHASSHASTAALVAGLGTVGLLAIAPYVLPRRRAGLWLVLATGAAFAWTSLATKLLTDELSSGSLGEAALWGAGTVVFAVVGVLSEQSSLQARPATQVAPIIYVVEVGVPVLLAPAIGGESWSHTPGGGAVLGIGLVLVAAGAAILGRSEAVAAVLQAEAPDRAAELDRDSAPGAAPARPSTSEAALGRSANE